MGSYGLRGRGAGRWTIEHLGEADLVGVRLSWSGLKPALNWKNDTSPPSIEGPGTSSPTWVLSAVRGGSCFLFLWTHLCVVLGVFAAE